MKILIAAGIFPPDPGGPATFAQKIFEGLKSNGHDVKVLTFCRGQRPDEWDKNIFCVDVAKPIAVRYVKFFVSLWKLSKGMEIIYAFDLLSVGLAGAILKIFRPKLKLVYRLGGDFQWEMALQKGYFDGTLWQYWEKKKFSWYEKIVYWLTNFSLKKADLIIFNANLIKDVFIKYRGVAESKAKIIKNIVPQTGILPSVNQRASDTIRIIFIGRLIAMKNLIRLIKALEELIKDAGLEKRLKLELDGEGPEARKIIEYVKSHNLGSLVKIGPGVGREQVFERINTSDIVANVSLTEVNAHFVAEALALKKRLILTKESEQFYTGFKSDLVYYINPLDVKDMAIQILRAIKDLDAKNVASESNFSNSAWPLEKVLREHILAFSGLTNQNEKNYQEN